jgi:hypothetical protein
MFGLLLLSAQVSTGSSPILWDRVHAGMTVAQLEQAYPKLRSAGIRHSFILSDRTEIGSNCPAQARAYLVRGSVQKVALIGDPEPIRTCFKRLRSQLIAKLGRGRKLGVLHIWRDAGIETILSSFTDSASGLVEAALVPSWSLTFSSAE